MSQVRLWGSFLLILGLIVAVLPLPVGASGYPLAVSDTEVEGALDYLRSAQADDGNIGGFGTSAWVVMALAAAGEDPHSWKKAGGNPSIVDYLKSNAGGANLSIATDVERMILAVVAADENPGNFGGVDFVAALKALYDGTQVGDAMLVWDDFSAVLALVAAGESPNSEIIQNTLSFIKSCQQPDGGWGYDVNASWGTDVDSTAAAIMALIAAGESPDLVAVTGGLSYIKSQQADSGGFLSWGTTNPSTDSWAIDAIVAAGQDPTSASWTKNGTTPVDDLLGFQNATDGSFPDWMGNPDPWTTSYALPALLGRPYPVRALELERLPVYVRVEGKNETVWRGEVVVSDSWVTADNSNVTYHLSNATALGALDEASGHEERFPYYVTDEWGWGLAVPSIAGEGDWDAGPWWQYRVDYCMAMVGADQFILNETHREVLWYCSQNRSVVPLNISVDKTAITAGGVFTATVEEYNDTDSTWTPCPNATVHADRDYVAGPDGKAAIRIFAAGSYRVFAEKDGGIRSDKVEVRVLAGSCSGCGGWGSTSYYSGKASLFGTELDYRIGRDGAVKDDIEAASEDGIVSIVIPRGTLARDGEGAPLRALGFVVNQTPPLPPEGSCLVGQACDFSPRGATFSPPMSLNWSYAPQALPQYVAEESLAIAYFDAANNSWVRLEGAVAPAGNRVSAPVSHFTTFALIGEVVPPPASFSLSDPVIEPGRVKEGGAVSISALLSNTGGTEGSYTVVLRINGAAEAEKEVTLAAGGAERVSFSLTKPAGSYNVSLGELQGSFIVLSRQSWLGRWWWAVMAGGVLGLVISLAAIRRRRA